MKVMLNSLRLNGPFDLGWHPQTSPLYSIIKNTTGKYWTITFIVGIVALIDSSTSNLATDSLYFTHGHTSGFHLQTQKSIVLLHSIINGTSGTYCPIAIWMITLKHFTHRLKPCNHVVNQINWASQASTARCVLFEWSLTLNHFAQSKSHIAWRKVWHKNRNCAILRDWFAI